MRAASRSLATGGVAAVLWLAGHVPAIALPCAAGLLTGAAAVESGWADDRPGLCRQITPADLPPPSASHSKKPRIVPPPADVVPQVPAGSAVSLLTRDDSCAAVDPCRPEWRHLRGREP